MNQHLKVSWVILAILLLFACDNSGSDVADLIENKTSNINSRATQQEKRFLKQEESPHSRNIVKLNLPPSAFKTIEWTDLLPQSDIDALMNPPSYITEIEDGSIEDQISNQLQNTITDASNDEYQQALVSTRIIPEMHDQPVRIPGFIVPLEFDDDQTITEFFLVPFFGACIHMPPPPPNQIIYVTYPEGFKLDVLYDPFWISGILKTSLITNNLATAAYSMQMQSFEGYTEE